MHETSSPWTFLSPSTSSSSLCMSIVNILNLTKSRRRLKSNLTTINFDYIDVHDAKYLPPSFNSELLFVLSHCLWVLLVHMVVLWMARIICMTATLGIQQKQQISKMVLDFLLDELLIPVTRVHKQIL